MGLSGEKQIILLICIRMKFLVNDIFSSDRGTQIMQPWNCPVVLLYCADICNYSLIIELGIAVAGEDP